MKDMKMHLKIMNNLKILIYFKFLDIFLLETEKIYFII
jgi:hypothetical protein